MNGSNEISDDYMKALAASLTLRAIKNFTPPQISWEQHLILRGRPPSFPHLAGYVYLCRSKNHPLTKIGFSCVPKKRQSQLQKDDPTAFIFYRRFADIYHERALHRMFLQFNARGEWFKLSESQIESIRSITDADWKQLSLDERKHYKRMSTPRMYMSDEQWNNYVGRLESRVEHYLRVGVLSPTT